MRNKKFNHLLERLKGTLQRGNWKLRGITRGYESKKTLNEIVQERSTPAGRTTSPQKMMFKNKSALSATTLHVLEAQKLDDDYVFERLEEEVDSRWGQLSLTERAILESNKRVGYRLDRNHLTEKAPLSHNRNISRGALVTILEEAFKEYENYESQKDVESQSHVSSKMENKYFDSIHDTLPLPSQDHREAPMFESMRPKAPDLNVPMFSSSKLKPADTRPYPSSRLEELEGTLLIKQNVLQQPSSYREARLKQEMTSGNPKCH